MKLLPFPFNNLALHLSVRYSQGLYIRLSFRILRSTWQRIKALDKQKDRKLSEVLKESMSSEPLAPVLSQKHLDAIDRRLKTIVEYVEGCIRKFGQRTVVVADYS